MKTMRVTSVLSVLSAALLLWTAPAPAATQITASLSLTNTPTNGAALLFNGTDARYWTNNTTNGTAWITLGTNVLGCATNLYNHLAAYAPTSLNSVTWTFSTSLLFQSKLNGPLAITSPGWGKSTYVTNTTYSAATFVTDWRGLTPAARTNQLSGMVDWLNQPFTTNFIALTSAPMSLVLGLVTNLFTNDLVTLSNQILALAATVPSTNKLATTNWVDSSFVKKWSGTANSPVLRYPIILNSDDALDDWGTLGFYSLRPLGDGETNTIFLRSDPNDEALPARIGVVSYHTGATNWVAYTNDLTNLILTNQWLASNAFTASLAAGTIETKSARSLAMTGTNYIIGGLATDAGVISGLVPSNNAAVPTGSNLVMLVSSVAGVWNLCGFADHWPGKHIWVANQSGYAGTFVCESGLDIPANRIRTVGATNFIVPNLAWQGFFYDGTSSRWTPTFGQSQSGTNSGGGGGATVLSALTDVSLTSPTNAQVLTYNGSVWVNSNAASSINTNQLINTNVFSTFSTNLTNLVFRKNQNITNLTVYDGYNDAVFVITNDYATFWAPMSVTNNYWSSSFTWNTDYTGITPVFQIGTSAFTNITLVPKSLSYYYGGLTTTSNVYAAKFYGDGANLTNLSGGSATNAQPPSANLTNWATINTNQAVFTNLLYASTNGFVGVAITNGLAGLTVTNKLVDTNLLTLTTNNIFSVSAVRFASNTFSGITNALGYYPATNGASEGNFILTNTDGSIVFAALNGSITNIELNNTNMVVWGTNSATTNNRALTIANGAMAVTNAGGRWEFYPDASYTGSNCAAAYVDRSGVTKISLGTNGQWMGNLAVYGPTLTLGVGNFNGVGLGQARYGLTANSGQNTNVLTFSRAGEQAATNACIWVSNTAAPVFAIMDGAYGTTVSAGIRTISPQAALHVNGMIRSDIGYASWQSNRLAVATLSPTGGAATWNWTNSYVNNVFVFLGGGSISAISINGTSLGTGQTNSGLMTIPLQTNEWVTATYSAPPTATVKPW